MSSEKIELSRSTSQIVGRLLDQIINARDDDRSIDMAKGMKKWLRDYGGLTVAQLRWLCGSLSRRKLDVPFEVSVLIPTTIAKTETPKPSLIGEVIKLRKEVRRIRKLLERDCQPHRKSSPLM